MNVDFQILYCHTIVDNCNLTENATVMIQQISKLASSAFQLYSATDQVSLTEAGSAGGRGGGTQKTRLCQGEEREPVIIGQAGRKSQLCGNESAATLS